MPIRRHLQRMKENDGKAARNATIRVMLWFGAAQIVMVMIYLLVRVEEGPPQIQHMHVEQQHHFFGTTTLEQHERAVLEGKYFLIELHASPASVAHDTTTTAHSSYHDVTGVFCPLDWHLQKSNPSSVAMYRDLINSSTHCRRHSIELNLREVVRQARQQHHVHSLQISGLVFHETRCGSTLVANLLSAADPTAHRVYSEASPLLRAMELASNTNADPTKAQELVSDVLYLMGRSNDARETRVFYKIQSVGVRYMDILLKSVDVPWMFVYRDSLEVIMSHFKDGKTARVCLRGRGRPHPLVTQVLSSQDRDVKSLTAAEYCAAHLASLCEAAMQHEGGRFINYDTLPDILWESVLPDWGVHPIHVDNMKKVAGVYSKGRGSSAKEWLEDSVHKQNKASEEMKMAVQTFLEPSFQKLQALAQERAT